MEKAIVHTFQTTSRDGPEFRTWFRGEHTHFNPVRARMYDPGAVREWVLKGWLPDRPLITHDTQITAFGSCFAANISNWLSRRHFRVLTREESARRAYVVAFGEGMVNSFVIRQQFEWAWEGKVFDQALWHGYDAKSYGYDPEVQAETRRIFDETDLFILTFGLSEVWYDEPTGNVFWRTIPKDAYDPARHKFRVSSVEENEANIRAIHDLIRKHRPDARIIITLSPIPLIATFRDNSCLTSNAVSKAILRVAIDNVMRDLGPEGHIFYWPSYELVTDIFHLPYKPDRRHPRNEVLDFIMTQFEHVWCVETPDNPAPPLAEAWAIALSAAGDLPDVVGEYVRGRKPWRLRQILRSGTVLDPDPDVNAAKRKLLADIVLGWAAAEKPLTEGPEVAQGQPDQGRQPSPDPGESC
ncbi:GSCFA domain-containing protein [Paracoccus sp. p4-l81]|uniref:GSCFA domain-containing protein n=1 Tax=Paracoccus sp. p4-l81 TaxID=3342806 RepID=UPI0035BAA6C7